jgi:hypothetical protein
MRRGISAGRRGLLAFPLRLDGVAAVAVNAFLGKLRRRERRIFRELAVLAN